MKIVQISDLHLSFHASTHRQELANKQWELLLAEVMRQKPDALAITGDLCFDEPCYETIAWALGRIKQLGLPMWVVPGNHDTSALISRAIVELELGCPSQWPALHQCYGKEFLLLDSSEAQLGEKQISWLSEKLEKATGPITIFVHHPLIPLGSAAMEAHHRLKDCEKVGELLAAAHKPVTVFSGHYHCLLSAEIGKTHATACPPAFCMIDPISERIMVSYDFSGFLVIDWKAATPKSHPILLKHIEGNKLHKVEFSDVMDSFVHIR